MIQIIQSCKWLLLSILSWLIECLKISTVYKICQKFYTNKHKLFFRVFSRVAVIPFKNISKEQSISDSLQLQTKLKSLERKSIRSIQVLLELVNEFEGIEKKLIKLVDKLLLNLDKNRVSGLVLIDYCKAFDMVDHQIVMSKLNAYRMDEKSARWFLSYLSGRQQFVDHSTFLVFQAFPPWT